jgi:type II secretory pathway component PulF
MGANLPLPTVILIGISDAMVRHWYVFVSGLAVLGVVAWRGFQTGIGRRWIEELLLHVPVVGSLVVKSLTSRTCEILKVLSQSGLPVLSALEMSAKTIGNRVVASELIEVRNTVAEGGDLASRFRASEVFPPLTGELISVGERSGALEEMLGAAADFYRQETERERKRMAAMIEPSLTICLGLLVLGIALAIFLPMWDSISLYRGGG